jgi:transcriptional repressor NrdR
MKCNQCQSDDVKVIESRDVAEGQAIRRRRMCVHCGNRFTTYERLERPQLIVIKNDGTRELFNRTKLLGGLYRACEKTPVTSLQLDAVINTIEQELYACGEQEVGSSKVGELDLTKLPTSALPVSTVALPISPALSVRCHRSSKVNTSRPKRLKYNKTISEGKTLWDRQPA